MADDHAGEFEESEVGVSASFVAGAKSFEPVEPGEAALDDPPVFAESRAVRSVTSGDFRDYAAFSQSGSVFLGVVGAVGEQPAWSGEWSSAFTANDRNRFQ